MTILSDGVNVMGSTFGPSKTLTVTPSTATIAVAGTVALSSTVVPAGGTTLWTTDDAAVATVNAGVVTGVAPGVVPIRAKNGSATDYAVVTVVAVTVEPATTSVVAGAKKQLTATVAPSGTVAWTTSDASKATVSSTGEVTGVAAGTATITATSGPATDTCVVTVTATARAAEERSIDPDELSVVDVKAAVAASPEQREAVLEAEKAGRNRPTLVEWLSDEENLR